MGKQLTMAEVRVGIPGLTALRPSFTLFFQQASNHCFVIIIQAAVLVGQLNPSNYDANWCRSPMARLLRE